MPRLRRAARERRQRPQLALGVWQYISGQKTYDKLSVATKWDLLVLPGGREYLERLREAVENDELEISEEKIHCMSDAPLLEDSPSVCAPKGAAPGAQA
jgi:hypothetical protein